MSNVDHPKHYQDLKLEGKPVEAINIINAFANMPEITGDESFLLGTIIKYLSRFPYKGKPVEDLQKAKWYLDKLIQVESARVASNSPGKDTSGNKDTIAYLNPGYFTLLGTYSTTADFFALPTRWDGLYTGTVEEIDQGTVGQLYKGKTKDGDTNYWFLLNSGGLYHLTTTMVHRLLIKS